MGKILITRERQALLDAEAREQREAEIDRILSNTPRPLPQPKPYRAATTGVGILLVCLMLAIIPGIGLFLAMGYFIYAMDKHGQM